MTDTLLALQWLPWVMMASGLLVLAMIVWQVRRARAAAQPGRAIQAAEPIDEAPRPDQVSLGSSGSGDVAPVDRPAGDDDITEEITLIVDGGALRDDAPQPSVAGLARYRGAEFAIKHLSNDEGSRRLSFELEALIRRAGWSLRGHGVVMGRTPQPVGVIIQHPGETPPDEVEALVQCLESLGHQVSLERYPSATALTLLVGVERS